MVSLSISPVRCTGVASANVTPKLRKLSRVWLYTQNFWLSISSYPPGGCQAAERTKKPANYRFNPLVQRTHENSCIPFRRVSNPHGSGRNKEEVHTERLSASNLSLHSSPKTE